MKIVGTLRKLILLGALLSGVATPLLADPTHEECKSQTPALQRVVDAFAIAETEFHLAEKAPLEANSPVAEQAKYMRNANAKERVYLDAYKGLVTIKRGLLRVGCVPAALLDKWVASIKEDEDGISDTETDLAAGLKAQTELDAGHSLL
jgi:hypothetical protein